jgi:hypothetical protein
LGCWNTVTHVLRGDIWGKEKHQQATQAVPEEQNDEDEYIDIMDGPTHGLQGQNVIRSGIKQQHSLKKIMWVP